MLTCDPCNTEFTHFMMARHLAQDHRLDLCRVCDGPVRSFQVTPLGATLDFCSGACIAELIRKRLCLKCLRTHTPSWETYFCEGCIPKPHFKNSVGGILAAIQGAARLPAVYARSSRDAWKLVYVRRDDVA